MLTGMKQAECSIMQTEAEPCKNDVLTQHCTALNWLGEHIQNFFIWNTTACI